MKTNLVVSGMTIKFLLSCGIIAGILTIITDLVAGLVKPGYNFLSQSASELSALGMPTRAVVVPLTLISGMCMLAFSTGMWLTATHNILFRIIALILILSALFSTIALLFFPLHSGEVMRSPANRLNVVIMFIGVFAFFLAICVGIIANTGWFRFFSAGLILLFVLLTIFGAIMSKSKLEIFGEHSQQVGIQERTMIYTWNLWLALQALVLLIKQ